MQDRSRSLTAIRLGDTPKQYTVPQITANGSGLCVNCRFFRLLHAPADDPPEPTCSNEEVKRAILPKGSKACQLFEHKMLGSVEVAEMLGVNEKAVRRMGDEWQDSGGATGLRGTKIGKLWRFCREDVFSFLEHRFRLATEGAESLRNL